MYVCTWLNILALASLYSASRSSIVFSFFDFFFSSDVDAARAGGLGSLKRGGVTGYIIFNYCLYL